jgi:glycosyltransferase involved in cell wall biosynthesis
VVDVVVPVYNEELDLDPSVRRLHRYLSERFPFSSRITIADNASTDRTLEIARALAAELPGVEVHHLDEKGRGRALKAAWSNSDADVLAYLDVCRPTSAPCSRWWLRWCRAIPTWPSVAV